MLVDGASALLYANCCASALKVNGDTDLEAMEYRMDIQRAEEHTQEVPVLLDTALNAEDDAAQTGIISPTSNRRKTPSKMPGIIKRAASSPNVRSLAMNEALLSSADKKRNKLGYHRTAVACGRPAPLYVFYA